MMFRRSEIGVTLLAPGRGAIMAVRAKEVGREVIISGTHPSCWAEMFGPAPADD